MILVQIHTFQRQHWHQFGWLSLSFHHDLVARLFTLIVAVKYCYLLVLGCPFDLSCHCTCFLSCTYNVRSLLSLIISASWLHCECLVELISISGCGLRSASIVSLGSLITNCDLQLLIRVQVPVALGFPHTGCNKIMRMWWEVWCEVWLGKSAEN